MEARIEAGPRSISAGFLLLRPERMSPFVLWSSLIVLAYGRLAAAEPSTVAQMTKYRN